MLFYSYEKLYLLQRGDSAKIMNLFGRLVQNKHDVTAYLTGHNWILNPQFLFLTKTSDIQKAEFLGLLSFRHYSEYKTTGKTELSVRDLPSWVDLSKLTPSTLWQKEGNTIVFPTENPPIVL